MLIRICHLIILPEKSTGDALQHLQSGLRNLPRKGPKPSRCAFLEGQCRCPQLSSLGLACWAVSIGSSEARTNWRGFLLPCCPGSAPAIRLEGLPAAFCPPWWESQWHKHQSRPQVEGGDPPPTLTASGLQRQQNHPSCGYLWLEAAASGPTHLAQLHQGNQE